MKCKKCGKELEGNLKVCSECKLKSKKNNKKIVIIIISILLLLILGFGALYFYNNSKYDYKAYEKQLEGAAYNYVIVNKINLSDKQSNIVIKDLYKDNFVSDRSLENKCDGYVIANKDEDDKTNYNAYIKCGSFYQTKGYNYTLAKKTYIEYSLEKEEEKEEVNTEIKNCPDFTSMVLESQYKFEKTITAKDIEGEYQTTVMITLSLYRNNIMHVYAKYGEQSYESSYGIYKIDGNKLTITRTGVIGDDNKCNTESKYIENKTDIFTISNDKNTLTTSVYLGKDDSYKSSNYISGEIVLTRVNTNNYEYTTSNSGLKLIVNKEINGWGYNYADEKGNPVFSKYYNINYIYKYNDKIYAYNSDSKQYEVYDLKTKKTITKNTKYNIYIMLENYILCYDNTNSKVVLTNLNDEVLKKVSYVIPDIGIQTIHLFKEEQDNNYVKKGIYMALFNTNKEFGCDVYSINGTEVKLIDADYCGY